MPLIANWPELALPMTERLMAQLETERNPLDDMVLTKEGAPKACLANAVLLLRHVPKWIGVLAYNEFTLHVVTKKPAPWQQRAGANWTDHDDSRTAEWLQHEGVLVNSAIAAEAVQSVARQNSFHPVREYLKGLTWDQKSRIDTWLIVYMGASVHCIHPRCGGTVADRRCGSHLSAGMPE